MITERTLRTWRGDALRCDKGVPQGGEALAHRTFQYEKCQERILKLTQVLLDIHLMRKDRGI